MIKHFKCKNCGKSDFGKYGNKPVYYCENCDTNIEVVYEFLYNPNICESVANTVSIHRTKKGAEMAMEFHKFEKEKEWKQTYNKNDIYFAWHFNQSWSILETPLQD